MPRFSESSDGKSDRSASQAATLLAGRTDEFLTFMFSDLGRRPEDFDIQDCIRIARYLDWLHQYGVPKKDCKAGQKAIEKYRRTGGTELDREERRSTELIADLLWGRVRSHEREQTASNQKSLKFLKKHTDTHFVGPNVEKAVQFVERFDVPAGTIIPMPKPTSLSRSKAVFRTNSRYPDDLSERIYAADHALKAAGIKRTRKRIAEALNQTGLRDRPKGAHDAQGWLPEEVNERVKAFHNSLKKRIRDATGVPPDEQAVVFEQERIVALWINSFLAITDITRSIERANMKSSTALS